MAEIDLEFKSKDVEKFFKNLSKNKDGISKLEKNFVVGIAAIAYKNVIRHFENEKGPNGSWKDWSPGYTKLMKKIGMQDNKILQFNGKLKQSINPNEPDYRTSPGRITLFTNAETSDGFPYAFAHNTGGPTLPKREFMWLDNKTQENLAKVTLGYLLGTEK